MLAPAKVNLYLEVVGKRPDGYHEISRLNLLTPTSYLGSRRFTWVPPAYANRCVFGMMRGGLLEASIS